jgi:menaquinone-specific isochorismate synthase
MTAYAGCGIVSDSIPEKELVETEMKFRPIVEAFS